MNKPIILKLTPLLGRMEGRTSGVITKRKSKKFLYSIRIENNWLYSNVRMVF